MTANELSFNSSNLNSEEKALGKHTVCLNKQPIKNSQGFALLLKVPTYTPPYH